MTASDPPTPGASGLRILHVGAGYRPLRRGGLIAYVEDLMGEQISRGHEVGYLFSGRYFPLYRGPRLKRWRRAGVAMFEVVNSPLDDHGRQPELEIAEAGVERIAETVIRDFRPDAVHVHELAGVPSSVFDVAALAGVPTVFTVQDYFALCPMFKLLDADGRSCLGHPAGEACLAAVLANPRPSQLLYEVSVVQELGNRLPPPLRRAWLADRVGRALTHRSGRGARRALVDRPRAATAYLQRREVNVERLNEADAVLAMSTRVAELYRQLGVTTDRLQTVQLTLAHIERLRPRRVQATSPVTFATLGGGEGEAKGAALLLDAARLLADAAAAGRFRLLLCGHVAPDVASAARTVVGVEIRGPYRPDALDAVLDEVDVGLMPSVWEEAYGYAGMEFLAKGIPVIANAIGGMADYVRDGETGWLNRSCTAEGLAEIMRSILDRPEQVRALSNSIADNRDSIVMPLARHADEMDTIYAEALRRRHRASSRTEKETRE